MGQTVEVSRGQLVYALLTVLQSTLVTVALWYGLTKNQEFETVRRAVVTMEKRLIKVCSLIEHETDAECPDWTLGETW